MKKFGVFAQDGYRGSIEMMRFLRDMNLDLYNAIVSLVGTDTVFIKGGEVSEGGGNTTITDGIVMHNQQLYSFAGGTYSGTPSSLYVVFREETAAGYPDPFFVGDAIPKKIYIEGTARIEVPEISDISVLISNIGYVKNIKTLTTDSNNVGEIKMFHGNVNDFFDTDTGLGLPGKTYASYAICNGSNGTPDLRNKFVVGAGDEYVQGDSGGQKQFTLVRDNIPAHRHGTSFLLLGRPFNTPGRFDEISDSFTPSFAANKQLNVNSVNPHGPGTGGSYHYFEMRLNTGNGTDNISNQDKLKATPDSVDNRPPYHALIFIKKIK